MSVMRRLFATKSLDELVAGTQEEGHQLKKVLGPWNLIALGVGAIIGAGIFATIGTAAAGDAHRPGAGPAVMVPFIVTLITIVLVWGIRESASFNFWMVAIKLVVLAFFVFVSFKYVKPAHWHPFAPNGFSGIATGAAIVFFAYIGFDAVSTTAEEAKNPKRDMPIGIIGSLIICTIIYAVIAAVFTGMIPYADLVKKLSSEQAEPLTLAMKYATMPNWMVGVVAFGSVIAHTAVLLVFQLGQPRIFFAMSRDGLLPQFFARVHPRFRTPHVATIITGVFVGVAALFSSLDEMVN